MTFSRKHYRLIADIINKSENKHQIVSELAATFARNNPRFDYQKWSKACGAR